ncbi:MAG: DUF1848 domain-containing protein [Spirochaetes bacterium]|nr:DUF1848 domain-containing protein [Spirochaetota bacterium]
MKMISSENIILKDGSTVKASVPMIISASRATDIPAFFSKWLINSFERGYAARINPFNGRKYAISFSNCRFIVFWSKNYQPMMNYINYFSKRNIDFYFQYTLNDYESENMEPGIPTLDSRICNFINLSSEYGSDRMVWRFDPLILTDRLNVVTLAERILRIYEKISTHTSSLVVSFADIEKYRKVKRNMTKSGIDYREWNDELTDKFCSILFSNLKNTDLKITTCAEKPVPEKYGIYPGACIDADRIKLLSASAAFETIRQSDMERKDPGQRKYCRCIQSRDIGSYGTCSNYCTYCYANNSEYEVIRNLKRFDPEGEGLCC